MGKPRDGGPAFPIPGHKGMSLRDYFAGQFLQAMAKTILETAYKANQQPKVARQILIESAYGIADAMIEEREKGEEKR